MAGVRDIYRLLSSFCCSNILLYGAVITVAPGQYYSYRRNREMFMLPNLVSDSHSCLQGLDLVRYFPRQSVRKNICHFPFLRAKELGSSLEQALELRLRLKVVNFPREGGVLPRVCEVLPVTWPSDSSHHLPCPLVLGTV